MSEECYQDTCILYLGVLKPVFSSARINELNTCLLCELNDKGHGARDKHAKIFTECIFFEQQVVFQNTVLDDCISSSSLNVFLQLGEWY